MGWGSDAMAALLGKLDFDYVALNPGASYRGLHDSIVNYNGNVHPTMLLCLHEEHAIAIAHGFAKVSGKAMLVIVHSNVGLMHATMAMFNAWCDRVPIVVLGANGPVDAAKRRPWIDWIHTTQDTGALVRSYTKWDDQPGSVAASLESILRANQYAQTAPYGPTYVVLDAGLQEQKLDKPLAIPDPKRFVPPSLAEPSAADVDRAIAILRGAKRPVILSGRVARTVDAWNARVAFAEAFGAQVITDFKIGSTFPSDHPLNAGPSGYMLQAAVAPVLREADVVLNLDFIDIAGTLKQVWGDVPPTSTIVSCSLDRYVHNGWSMDYFGLPPVDFEMAVDPDVFIAKALAALGSAPKPALPTAKKPAVAKAAPAPTGDAIGIDTLSDALNEAFKGRDTCYIRLPLGAAGQRFDFGHPLDYLGYDGGGGIGSGPGMAVGAALALRGTGRLPVAVLGDGDYLMASSALWTAVANDIPLLVVVSNNRSYFNDELHQDRMARLRDRPVERRWIGQRIDGPAPDIATNARSFGAIGIGPITRLADLPAAFIEARTQLEAGKVVVLDVVVTPGYDPAVEVATVIADGSTKTR